jgi:hypothetical protein
MNYFPLGDAANKLGYMGQASYGALPHSEALRRLAHNAYLPTPQGRRQHCEDLQTHCYLSGRPEATCGVGALQRCINAGPEAFYNEEAAHFHGHSSKPHYHVAGTAMPFPGQAFWRGRQRVRPMPVAPPPPTDTIVVPSRHNDDALERAKMYWKREIDLCSMDGYTNKELYECAFRNIIDDVQHKWFLTPSEKRAVLQFLIDEEKDY